MVPDLDFKKGWKTSEFWLALVPTAIVLLSLVGVDVTPEDLSNVIVAVSGLVAAVYALGRSLLKAKRVETVGNLVSTQTYVAADSLARQSTAAPPSGTLVE